MHSDQQDHTQGDVHGTEPIVEEVQVQWPPVIADAGAEAMDFSMDNCPMEGQAVVEQMASIGGAAGPKSSHTLCPT